jgi:hypothetical protein
MNKYWTLNRKKKKKSVKEKKERTFILLNTLPFVHMKKIMVLKDVQALSTLSFTYNPTYTKAFLSLGKSLSIISSWLNEKRLLYFLMVLMSFHLHSYIEICNNNNNNSFLRSRSSQHTKLVYEIPLFVGQGTPLSPSI